jgi:hypothetical protein
MTSSVASLLVWSVLAQGAATAAGAALTLAEKTQLDRETRLDDRVRVYEGATTRLLRQVEGDLKHEPPGHVGGTLEAWTDLLRASLEDIRGRMPANKKSRAVIRYEIALRKAISALKELALRTPEQREALEQWLAAAEPVRKGLVDLLFQR